jgi:hypothetical protein
VIRLWILFFLFGVSTSFAQHDVYYGQRDLTRYANDLFIDKAGDVYPHLFIHDSLLFQYEGTIRNVYYHQPLLFSKALQQYAIHQLASFDTLYQLLQKKIIQEKVAQWQQSPSNDTAIYFLIHGFRKPFYDAVGDYTSAKDFQLMKQALHLNQRRTVCVYWDATYDCCFSSNVKKNKELFQLFVEAQKRTPLIAKKLASVLNQSQIKNVYLVSHSLGAKIFIESLSMLEEQSKLYNLLLVAPAVSAYDLIEGIQKKLWHYLSIGIVYNRHDFVLKKKDPYIGWLGPGVKKYGETSLGCNKNHAQKKILWYQEQYPYHLTFTFFDYQWVGKGHHVRNYFLESHLLDVREFIRSDF